MDGVPDDHGPAQERRVPVGSLPSEREVARLRVVLMDDAMRLSLDVGSDLSLERFEVLPRPRKLHPGAV